MSNLKSNIIQLWSICFFSPLKTIINLLNWCSRAHQFPCETAIYQFDVIICFFPSLINIHPVFFPLLLNIIYPEYVSSIDRSLSPLFDIFLYMNLLPFSLKDRVFITVNFHSIQSLIYHWNKNCDFKLFLHSTISSLFSSFGIKNRFHCNSDIFWLSLSFYFYIFDKKI